MTYTLGKKSLAHLEGVHPELVDLVKKAITTTIVDFQVHCGLRSVKDQAKAVDSGNSWTMRSRHLTGHAVDLVALEDLDNDGAKDDLSWRWPLYFKIAEAMRDASRTLKIPVIWGGVWDRNLALIEDPAAEFLRYQGRRKALGRPIRQDGPHFELPRNFYPENHHG